MSDTLAELLNNVSAFKSGSEAATQQILKATGIQSDLAEQSAKRYDQVAKDTTIVAAAKNSAELIDQANRARAASIFGTNLKDQNEQITKLAKQADDAQKAKDQALANIADKDSDTIFNNPLGWILNKFTINSDIAQHNTADAQLESAEKRIATINAATQTTVVTQNAISEPLTAAAAEAATRNTAAAAELEANKARQSAQAFNLNGIQGALTASKESLSVQFSAQNAQQTERQIGISLAHLSLAKDAAKERIREFDERQNDKKEQQLLGQDFVDTVNKGRTALGFQPLDDVNGKMLIAALKNKSPIGDQMTKFYNAGEATKYNGGATVVGATPSQAAGTISSLPNLQIPAIQQPITKILAASSDMTQVNRDRLSKGLPPLTAKDKEEVQAAFNQNAQNIVNTMAKNIKPDDSANVFQIGSINQLGEASPTVRALPVYQKVFEPLIKRGDQINTPKRIFSLVSDAVAKGTITHNEALELTTIYQVGVKTNLMSRNLPGFGLVPSLSYNTAVETNPNSTFNPDTVIDMTKPDQLSRALIKLGAMKMTTPGFTGVHTELYEPFNAQFAETRSKSKK